MYERVLFDYPSEYCNASESSFPTQSILNHNVSDITY